MIQIPAKGRDDVSGSNFRSVRGEFLDFGYRNTTAVGNHLEHALNGKVIWEALTYRSRTQSHQKSPNHGQLKNSIKPQKRQKVKRLDFV